jgi:methyl-accepting chemotaxis protein
MRQSIRTRFTLGMIFLFLIILLLSVFSGFYLNRLSEKNSAILKENYLSLVYAREMSEGIMTINKEITTKFLTGKSLDSLKLTGGLEMINSALQKEKNNITEPGEDKLVSGIDSDLSEYKDSLSILIARPASGNDIINLQSKSGDLYRQLSILSQMNGRALEVKTDDAKAYSKSALEKMTIIASLSFLIGMSFIFSFASYFNQKFFQLYEGIKNISSNNYEEHLIFEDRDEFYEISLVLNEMADKLKKNKQKLSVTLPSEAENDQSLKDIEDLKTMLFRIKVVEEQASALISKLEKRDT